MKGQLNFLDELIIDNFAGGGGASCGIELATGRPVDIAINHNAQSKSPIPSSLSGKCMGYRPKGNLSRS